MTPRLGSLQRRILAALAERRDHDHYHVAGISDLFDACAPPTRARWRWYTLDLLDLVDGRATEVSRASLHQAARTLATQGLLQTSGPAYPYSVPFTGYRGEDGAPVGAVDLAELHTVDPRWPRRGGRRLWFRLPPPGPAHIPPDDQLSVLAWLSCERPDGFEDFAATVDRRRAWNSDTGRFLRWLLCGRPPTDTSAASVADNATYLADDASRAAHWSQRLRTAQSV